MGNADLWHKYSRSFFPFLTCAFDQVDMDRPLEQQGPFDLIIQKLTDYMAAAIGGNKDAMKILKGLEVIVIMTTFIKLFFPMDF